MSLSLGLFFGVVAMLAWGASDFLGAFASKKTGDSAKMFTLSRIVSLAVLIIVFPFFKVSLALSLSTIILLFIAGLLSAGAGIAFYQGMTVGDVSIISPVSAVYPVITVLLSVLLLSERLTALQVIAILIAIIGSLLAAMKWEDLIKLNAMKKVQGIEYAIYAMVGWGVGFFLIGLLAKSLGGYLPILAVYLFGFIFLLPYSRMQKKPAHASFNGILPLFILLVGVLGVAGYLAYGVGTAVSEVSLVSVVSSVYSMITIILATVFLKEKLDANQLLGIAMIMVALVMLSL